MKLNLSFVAELCSALLIFTLAACTAAPYPSDPYSARAGAQATQDAASAQIQATRDRQDQLAFQATLQGAQTRQAAEAEIQLLQARATATRSAYDMQLIRQSARQTEFARPAQETLGAMSLQSTQIASQGTQVAMIARITQTALDQRNAELRANVWPLVSLVLSVCILLLALYMLRELFAFWLTWKDRKHSLFQTSAGPVVFYDSMPYLVTSLDQVQRFRNMLPPPEVSGSDAQEIEHVSQGGITVTGPMPFRQPTETTAELVYSLLEAAARRAGGMGTNRIPRYSDLGWSSEKWQRAVAALRDAGCIQTSNAGTFVVNQFTTVGDLLEAVQTHQVRIRPAPPARVFSPSE